MTGLLNSTGKPLTVPQHNSIEHAIGEEIPAPTIILPPGSVASLGSSSVPAREDHIHGYNQTVPNLAARDALTGMTVGTLVSVVDQRAIYIWNGTVWSVYQAPTYGAAFTYTPTTTGITLGTGGTTTGLYIIMPARLVLFSCFTQLGTAGIAVGTGPTWSLPLGADTADNNNSIGTSIGYDATGALQQLNTIQLSGTAVEPRFVNATPALLQISATTPITWAINDRFHIRGVYRASAAALP